MDWAVSGELMPPIVFMSLFLLYTVISLAWGGGVKWVQAKFIVDKSTKKKGFEDWQPALATVRWVEPGLARPLKGQQQVLKIRYQEIKNSILEPEKKTTKKKNSRTDLAQHPLPQEGCLAGLNTVTNEFSICYELARLPGSTWCLLWVGWMSRLKSCKNKLQHMKQQLEVFILLRKTRRLWSV